MDPISLTSLVSGPGVVVFYLAYCILASRRINPVMVFALMGAGLFMGTGNLLFTGLISPVNETVVHDTQPVQDKQTIKEDLSVHSTHEDTSTPWQEGFIGAVGLLAAGLIAIGFVVWPFRDKLIEVIFKKDKRRQTKRRTKKRR